MEQSYLPGNSTVKLRSTFYGHSTVEPSNLLFALASGVQTLTVKVIDPLRWHRDNVGAKKTMASSRPFQYNLTPYNPAHITQAQ